MKPTKKNIRPKVYPLLDRAVACRDGRNRERQIREMAARLVQSI